MNVTKIGNILQKLPSIEENKKSSDEKFSNLFTDLIQGVSQDQQESDKLTKGLMEGEDVELHEVMLAGKKAETSLELLLQIRKRIAVEC